MGETHATRETRGTCEIRELGLDARIEEDDESTETGVTVRIRGRDFTGRGRARRNPTDPSVPLIGEELSLARALNDLAHHLVEAAADRIEEHEGRPVTLRG